MTKILSSNVTNVANPVTAASSSFAFSVVSSRQFFFCWETVVFQLPSREEFAPMAYINDLLKDHPEEFYQLKCRVKDVLPKFRDNYLYHDVCLFKFLVARDFDVTKAEEMVRKHLNWRQENKIDEIFKFIPPPAIMEAFPCVITGVDKRGCTVVYHPLGKWKAKKAVKMGWKNELLAAVRFAGSIMLELSRRLSTNERPVSQYYMIMDMAGLDISQFLSIELVRITREILQDYQDNFPELVSYIRVINAPRIYQLVWAVVEPVLTGRTISKIEFYGTNKDAWKEKLLQDITPDNLPSCCGGSITTCFPYQLDSGLERMFPVYETLGPDANFEEVVVPARQSHVIEVELRAGEKLTWNFDTKDYDIGFQVDRDDLKSTLVEYSRVDSHKFMQKGSLVCETAGKYRLVFDNSYSKFKAKELRYAVEIKTT